MVSIGEVHAASAIGTAAAAWSHQARIPTVPDVQQATRDERDYRRRLGKVIVDLRLAANKMSQAELAQEHLHRSEAALSRWENGKATPTAYDLHVIAKTFGLRTEDLHLLIFPPAVYSPEMERLFARVESYVNRLLPNGERVGPAAQAEGRRAEATDHAVATRDKPRSKPGRSARATAERPPR